jgi:hypothetical protein
MLTLGEGGGCTLAAGGLDGTSRSAPDGLDGGIQEPPSAPGKGTKVATVLAVATTSPLLCLVSPVPLAPFVFGFSSSKLRSSGASSVSVGRITPNPV